MDVVHITKRIPQVHHNHDRTGDEETKLNHDFHRYLLIRILPQGIVKEG